MNSHQKRENNGRFGYGRKPESPAELIEVDSGVNDTDPANRAAALMDPECPLDALEHAALNDTDSTVRLCVAPMVPHLAVNDRNPVVRLLSYHHLGESAAGDQEASRVLELLAA